MWAWSPMILGFKKFASSWWMPTIHASTSTARPSDFMAAAPFNRLFGPLTAPLRLRPGFGEEQTLFMGVLVPLLALAGLWRRDWVSWWLGGLAVYVADIGVDFEVLDPPEFIEQLRRLADRFGRATA